MEVTSPLPKDLVIVVDTSDSMRKLHQGRSLMQIAIEAAATVVDTLGPNDRVRGQVLKILLLYMGQCPKKCIIDHNHVNCKVRFKYISICIAHTEGFPDICSLPVSVMLTSKNARPQAALVKRCTQSVEAFSHAAITARRLFINISTSVYR